MHPSCSFSLSQKFFKTFLLNFYMITYGFLTIVVHHPSLSIWILPRGEIWHHRVPAHMRLFVGCYTGRYPYPSYLYKQVPINKNKGVILVKMHTQIQLWTRCQYERQLWGAHAWQCKSVEDSITIKVKVVAIDDGDQVRG